MKENNKFVAIELLTYYSLGKLPSEMPFENDTGDAATKACEVDMLVEVLVEALFEGLVAVLVAMLVDCILSSIAVTALRH